MQNPTGCGPIRRLSAGQLLPAAVAEDALPGPAPAPRPRRPRNPNRKKRRRPRHRAAAVILIRRAPPWRPHAHGSGARSRQPEMPERTHAQSTPRPAISTGSRRTVPIAGAGAAEIESAGRGAALARARKRSQDVKRGPFEIGDSRSGRARPRAVDAKIQQNASPSEGFRPASCCRRLLPKAPSQVRPRRRRRGRADLETQTEKTAAAAPSGSSRDLDSPRAASAPARPRIRARSRQPEMPERTHAQSTPQPAVSIGSRRTVPLAGAGAAGSKPLAEGPPSRARGNGAQKGNAAPFR